MTQIELCPEGTIVSSLLWRQELCTQPMSHRLTQHTLLFTRAAQAAFLFCWPEGPFEVKC